MKKFVYIGITLSLLILAHQTWASKNSPALQATLKYQINGVTDSIKKNVLAHLTANEQGFEKPLTTASIKSLYQNSDKVVQAALQPFGYFKPQIKSKLLPQGAQWLAIYDIYPGPPLRITKINISLTGQGKNEPDLIKATASLPLHIGDVVLTEQYNLAKQSLFDVAIKKGYLRAKLSQHQIQVDMKHYTAAIQLQFDTGPRFFFGLVSFNKNPYRESFLRRYLTFKEGQVYATDDILLFQNALTSSNYFQYVVVTPHVEQSKNQKVPISVQLTPRKPQQYVAGIGYGTDTGPRASLGWEWRRVTATGHRLGTLLRVSKVQNSFQAIYTIPGKNPAKDQYNINASLITNDISQGKSHTGQFGGAYISTIGNWQQNLSLNYQLNKSQLKGEPWHFTKFLIPGVAWTRLKTDNPTFPRNGSRLNISLQGALENIASDASFLQGEIQGKLIHSPTEKSRIIWRGDFGYTASNHLSILPLPLQFFAGGTQSIRGFNYQSLGPGRYLVVGSVELQHQIINKWHAAVFFDVGNAMNHFSKLQRAAGAGIMWVSPVGPIEVTFAKTVSQPGNPWRIQFTMGPDL